MRRISIGILVVFIFALFGTALASAAPEMSLDWNVIGGGGGENESSDGTYSLNGTIGQPVAGAAGEELCSGFWCGVWDWARIFLPKLKNDFYTD
jgi:hypothetical protein